jgi:hypothetical protein
MGIILGSMLAMGPAQAAGAGAGCPRGWTLAPVSVLGEDFTGVADNVNHDGLVCIKHLRTTGVYMDNVAP